MFLNQNNTYVSIISPRFCRRCILTHSPPYAGGATWIYRSQFFPACRSMCVIMSTHALGKTAFKKIIRSVD